MRLGVGTPARSIAGEAYVRALEASASARLERQVFQRVALLLAGARSNIFDFGSGPGLDARVYAEQGHSVAAFDTDPEMREYFSGYCGDLIEQGRVVQHVGGYDDFLAGEPKGWADLITSNFAPLNLVGELRPLFRRFHELSRGRALVLASVLNPTCASDIRYGWWWRGIGRYVREGEFHLEGNHGWIHRRSVQAIGGAASPFFRVLGAIPNVRHVLKNAENYRRRLGSATAWRPMVCRYKLVVLERLPHSP